MTIRDVAEKAGVSYQTVSRVINESPNVSSATRQHILQVIEELGYFPNATARSLASNKTRTLGLIVPELNEYVYIEAIKGAEKEAKKHGYFFMLGITESDDTDEPEYYRWLTERRVEGNLFLYPSLETGNDHHYLDSLLNAQLPLVTIAYQALHRKLTIVNIDNEDGGRQATEHLISQGHRHIGMITGHHLWEPARRRTQGYLDALAAASIPHDPALIVNGDWSYASGEMGMCQLLDRAPHITAVFAQNDQMAIGAIRAIRAQGRQIPDDMAVIGYDGMPVTQYYQPAISTIYQPMEQVGQAAARMLIEMIDNPRVEPREILLKPQLVRRETT